MGSSCSRHGAQGPGERVEKPYRGLKTVTGTQGGRRGPQRAWPRARGGRGSNRERQKGRESAGELTASKLEAFSRWHLFSFLLNQIKQQGQKLEDSKGSQKEPWLKESVAQDAETREGEYMDTFRGRCVFSCFSHPFKRNQNSFQGEKIKKTNQQVLFSHLCGSVQGILTFLLAGSPPPPPCRTAELAVGGGCWVLDGGCWVVDAGCWVVDAGCWVLGGRWWARGANVCPFSFTHAAWSLLSVTRPLLLASLAWNSAGQNCPLECGGPSPPTL